MQFSQPVWRKPQPVRPYSTVCAERPLDLIVVGGGILGMSTALSAARAGLRTQVLEAKAIGHGASGLNGGQVIPGLKYDPDWLVEHLGDQRGEALVSFAASTADAVFDLIESEKLDVPFTRNGWIQAAHTEAALSAAEKRDRQWRARGADAKLLDAAEIKLLTGADGYIGGWLDRRAGVIDPLAYTMELARIATEAGAHIAERQTVRKLRQESDVWRVSTSEGNEFVARFVVVATNAYSDDLITGMAQTIVPLHSFQIATAPLASDLAKQILPYGQAVSDSRRLLIYYRKTADGRFMLGGRGRMAEPTTEVDWAHLQRAMLRLFPALSNVAVERRCFGRVAMTPDHLPHVHMPEKGLFAVIGCQGRGLGLMTAMGQRLADHIVGGRDLPFPISPIRPIPLHAFRQIGVAAAITWYRMLDAIER